MKKKLLSLFTLALLGTGSVWAADAIKVGFTSSISGTEVAAPTVTTQDKMTVSVARGKHSTGSNKGSMYWGSTTALTFKGTCERTQYNSAGITEFNDDVWTGASIAIASGYKFTVTDLQVDIAGQDYEWGYKLDVVNGDGTTVYQVSATTGKPKASSKLQVTATGKSIVLTGTAYVKLYFYLKGNTSTSKYLAIPELYLTGAVEENVQTKYTKPTITQGAYNQENGTYAVTLAVQNEEDGTINYTVGSGAEVTGAASGTVVNVAPNTQIAAYVTGSSYSNSDNNTLTTSAAPTLATPTYSITGYNLFKNTYTVALAAAAGDITYTVGGSSDTYSTALELAPSATVEAYATLANMTQSATLSFTVPAAPVSGSAASPTEKETYSTDADYIMGAITIPGACIAGQISSGSSPINGSIKTRCNQTLTSGKGFYVNVNPGYTVTAISIEGCSNQTGANTCTAVYVDGTAVDGFASVSLPQATSTSVAPGTINVTGIKATSKIEFAFENTYQGQMNITVTYDVSASATLSAVSGFSRGFATFCAPRNFTVAGATAYSAKVSGDAIVLTEVEGVVPANTGVIIAGDDAAEYTLTYVTDAAATVSGNELKGITARTATSELAGTSTLLALNSSKAEFQQYTGAYFPACKAYLLVADASRQLKIAFGAETTAVSDVNEASSKPAAVKYVKHGRLVIETARGAFGAQGMPVR